MTKKDWLIFSAIAAVLVIVRIMFYGPYFDDGFIYFRYIENLFLGHGLVYNVLERVQSQTSFLYPFILMAIKFFKAPLPQGAAAFGIICDLGTLYFLIQICKKLNFTYFITLIVAALFALDGSFASVTVSGLETPMYVLLAVLSFYLYIKNFYKWLGLVLGLVCLTRIDGLALVAALVLVEFFYEKKIHKDWVIYPVVFLCVFSLMSYLYYGTVVQDSVAFKFFMEKFTGFSNRLQKFDAIFGLRIFSETNLVVEKLIHSRSLKLLAQLCLGVFSLAGFIFTIWVAKIKKSKYISAMVLWILFYSAAFIITGAPASYTWYFVVPLPIYLVLLAQGFILLKERFNAKSISRLTNAVFALVILFMLGANLVIKKVHFNYAVAITQGQVPQAIKWMSENVKPNEKVSISADGMFGYGAMNVRMLDVHGLVSPEVLAFRRQQGLVFNEKYDSNWEEAKVIQNFKPAYVLSNEKVYEYLGKEKSGYVLAAKFDRINIYKAK